MLLEQLKKRLRTEDLPHTLEQLIAFEAKHGFESYASGFGLLEDEQASLVGWSTDRAFAAQITPFAQANGSGSFYAFWEKEVGMAVAQRPIIVFGDEGDLYVVAQNFDALLPLLALDNEIYIDEDEASFEEGDPMGSEHHAAFVQWYEQLLQQAPTPQPAATIAAARDQHQADFEVWSQPFLPH